MGYIPQCEATAQAFDNTARYGQAQPCPARLRCDKGLEKLLRIARTQALPRIVDLDDEEVIALIPFCFQNNSSSPGSGINGIDEDIKQNLLQATRIGFDF